MLLNRALEYRVCVSFFEQDHEAAEIDCQKILETDKNNQIALLKLGFLALTVRNESAEAIRYFERVSDKNLLTMGVVIAGAYINIGDLEKAKSHLNAFKREAEKKKLWYVLAHEKLRIAEIENTVDDVISQLLAEYSSKGDVLFAIAELYKRRGNTRKALELFEEAIRSAECTLRLFIPRLKAQTYYDAGLWTAAASAYESISDLRNNEKDWFEYIAALANIEDKSMLGSAGVEAKNARISKGGEVIPVISEIEATAELIKFNEPRKALRLLIDLWKTHPHSSITEQLIKAANTKIGRDPMDLSAP